MPKAPVIDTLQVSRSGENPESGRTAPFLFRTLECTDLSAGAGRHSLADVHEVVIERGERSHSRSLAEGRRTLTLRVPDATISARHARILRSGAAFSLEDLGSRNGCIVDGAKVTSAELADGSLIELGSTLFLFREARADGALPPDKVIDPGQLVELATLSPDFEQGLARLRLVAKSAISVLLIGETGTGKEVLAREVHWRSGRQGPLVAVNCGAIPGSLVEAQLFGHARGAFTGAIKDELGFVRRADGGTLFLDEIAELPLASQAALLRVLQSGELTPVGSSQSVRVDVRIVAATHKDLETLAVEGLFRRDLYARLAGFIQFLPPLEDRLEDLGLLIALLLDRHARGARVELEVDAARALFAYNFPLNVRELEQALCAALVLAAGGPLSLRHLPDTIRPNHRRARSSSRPPGEKLSAEDAAICEALTTALRETGGNVTAAARRMGKARQQIQRWARRYGIAPAQFRRP